MLYKAFDFAFLRIILPITLFIASFLRYNGFSFVYLCFLLVCPLLKRCKTAAEELSVKCYLGALVGCSALFSVAHGLFHAALAALSEPLTNAAYNCSGSPTWIQAFRQIGLQNLRGMKFHRALRLVFADPFVLTVSVALLAWHLYRSRQSLHETALLVPPSRGHSRQPSYLQSQQDQHEQVWRAWFIDYCGVLLTVILTGVAGIMSPSLLAIIYLLIFVGICTYWACRFKHISLHISYARVLLLVYSGLHVMLHYLYQLPILQTLVLSNSSAASLLGLYFILQPNCSSPGEIHFAERRWIDYVAPCVTLALCYVVAVETRRWCDKFNINNPLMVLSYVRCRLRRNETTISTVSSPPHNIVTSGGCTPRDDADNSTHLNTHTQTRELTAHHPQTHSSSTKPNNRGLSKASSNEVVGREHRPQHRRMASDDHRVRLLEVHYLPAGHGHESVSLQASPPEVESGTTKATAGHTRTHSAVSMSSMRRNSGDCALYLSNHNSKDSKDSVNGIEAQTRTSLAVQSNETAAVTATVVTERPLVLSIIHTAIRNSYVLSLIAMMV